MSVRLTNRPLSLRPHHHRRRLARPRRYGSADVHPNHRESQGWIEFRLGFRLRKVAPTFLVSGKRPTSAPSRNSQLSRRAKTTESDGAVILARRLDQHIRFFSSFPRRQESSRNTANVEIRTAPRLRGDDKKSAGGDRRRDAAVKLLRWRCSHTARVIVCIDCRQSAA